LEIDPLNISYNSTIYMNLGIAYSKEKKNEEALKMLNKSIQANPDYVKAYVKRAEIQ
jgi:Tfp pilus assembly protein PilF